MAGGFDPHLKWLGIPREEQPADRYRLFGLTRFESDEAVIEAAIERTMETLRQQAVGPRANDAHKLMSELALAQLDLLDPTQKARYDAKLKEQASKPKAEPTKDASARTEEKKRPPSAPAKTKPASVRRGDSPKTPAKKTSAKSQPPANLADSSRVVPLDDSGKAPAVREGASKASRDSHAPTRKKPSSSSSMTERARPRRGKTSVRTPQVASDTSDAFDEDDAPPRSPVLLASLVGVLVVLLGIGAVVLFGGGGESASAVAENGDSERQEAAPSRTPGDRTSSSKPKVAEEDAFDREAKRLESISKASAASRGPTQTAPVNVPLPEIDSSEDEVSGFEAADDEADADEYDSISLEGKGEIAGLEDEGDGNEGDGDDDFAFEETGDEDDSGFEVTEDEELAALRPKADRPSRQPAPSEAVRKKSPSSPGSDTVKASPPLRAKESGESARDYLAAIGLVEQDGKWVLAIESEVDRLLQQFEAEEEKQRTDADKARRDAKAFLGKRSQKQYGKEKKTLLKRISKLGKAEKKAAADQFKAEWAEKRNERDAFVPLDAEVRFGKSKRLEQAFDAAKKVHFVEHGALTYKGLVVSQGEINAAKAIAEKFKAEKERFALLKDAYAKQHSDSVDRAQVLVGLAKQAESQAKRVQFEYGVLANVSGVAEAIGEAKGELNIKSVSSLASKVSRKLSAAKQQLTKELALTPFSDQLYAMPERESIQSVAISQSPGGLDTTYAALNAADDPAAYLAARGLTRRGDYWLLRAEQQVSLDLPYAAKYLQEAQRLAEPFTEEVRAALTAEKVANAKENEKLAKEHGGIFGGVVDLGAAGGWRNRKRRQLADAYPVEQREALLLATDDAIANLKAERIEFLSQALEFADELGVIYGDLASEDEVIAALEQAGGSVQPSPDFGSTYGKLQQLVNQTGQ